MILGSDMTLGLSKPSIGKQVLEKLGLREVRPADLCKTSAQLSELYNLYPDLLGDRTAIGPGDDGNCQSWRGHPRWWIEMIERER